MFPFQMRPQPITEKDGVHNAWYDEARKQTIKTLPAFMKKLAPAYKHDYGTICHAVAASAIAAAWSMNRTPQGGITGFQADAIMWEFVGHWNYEQNVCGLKIVDYDNLLYPQYAHHFENTISQDVMDKLQAEAKKNLAEDRGAAEVRAHWQSIAGGKPPFGFTIKPE